MCPACGREILRPQIQIGGSFICPNCSRLLRYSWLFIWGQSALCFLYGFVGAYLFGLRDLQFIIAGIALSIVIAPFWIALMACFKRPKVYIVKEDDDTLSLFGK